jgi:hypothetical protein
MRNIKIGVGILSLALSQMSYGMFCPNNFNEINIGDTVAQVEKQCGKPAADKTTDDSAKQPQEWIYFTKTQPSDPTSLRMTIGFEKGIVTNMTVNNVGVSSTQICGGNTATVGATEQAIKTACGAPAYVKKSNNPGGKIEVTKVTKLTYQGTSDVVLTFEDGLLKSRD